MIPPANITAWRAQAPWADDAQVEQDLVLSRAVVECFLGYMAREGHPLTRAQFEQNLHGKEMDPAFLSDIDPLLRPGTSYDAAKALGVVRKSLIELLPGDPWRGSTDT